MFKWDNVWISRAYILDLFKTFSILTYFFSVVQCISCCTESTQLYKYLVHLRNMSDLLWGMLTAFPRTIRPESVNQIVAICKCTQVAISRKQLRCEVSEFIYMYAHARKCGGVTICQQRYVLDQRFFDKAPHL